MELLWRRIAAYLPKKHADPTALGHDTELSWRTIALSEWPGGALVPGSRDYDAPT